MSAAETTETTVRATCGCDTRVRTTHYRSTGVVVVESVHIVWACGRHNGGKGYL